MRCAIAAVLAASNADAAIAQSPAPAPAAPAESQAPRAVRGRVVRPGKSGMVTVAGAWVTLHRVAPDSSGPVDSVRADANGRYSMRYTPTGGDAVYFASSMFGGVAYFTAPLPATDAAGDAGEITVFDTTSSPVAIQTRGRHLVVSASGVDGRRTLVEVFELSNDSTVTAIAGVRGRATWSAPLAPNATNFQVGQSDISGNAVQFRDGRVLVYASISPGIRQLAFSYSVPAEDFPLTIPVSEPVGVFEVLLEDPGASASGGPLAEQQPVTLEGRSFRRFLAQDMRSGSDVTITVGAPTAPRGNRYVYVLVAIAAAIMAVALAFTLTRRRGSRVVVREPAHDAAHLARDIAELDESFARNASPSDAERVAYQQRRQALKAQLTAALANEEVPV
ncbi:MAG TPA: hypothetical protein VM076_25545 [Gemmatimonadaceae bacterium]|nr:hypothetical protein [Gemmatimonadaceae bacterium]